MLYLPKLTDGIIFLRPLDAEDAADHLAGEDEEMAKWVSGGRSTLAGVEAFIRNNQESWRNGGPRRAFGIFDCASNQLIGFIEVNLARLAGPTKSTFHTECFAHGGAKAWPYGPSI